MKKLIVVASICACAIINSHSQTSITNVPSFFNTAASYFTSFNTNLLTFQDGYDHFDVDLGTENYNNANLDAIFSGRGQIGTTHVWGLATFYNDSVFGNIERVDSGIGYGFTLYDVKVTPAINVGYDFGLKGGYVRPSLDLRKAMTAHTYAGIGIDLPIRWAGQQNNTPGLMVFTGFNF